MERVIAPYSYPKNIPSAVKNLPKEAQKLFIEVFNKVYKDTNDENKARMAGWGAVKNKYVKKGGVWVLKAALESLEFTISSVSISDREDGNKEYSISLRMAGYTGSVYLSFDTQPSDFLMQVGSKIIVTLSDEEVQTSKTVVIDNASAFYPGNFISHIITAASTEEEKKAQQARSKKYGIAILEGGHVTKPSQYASVSDGMFADPVNYNYPCDNETRAKAAVRYFGMPRNYEKYSESARNKVWGRMKRLAKKHMKDMEEKAPWKRKEG